jgi:hypothetical protein
VTPQYLNGGSWMDEIRSMTRPQVRQRLTELWQTVPRDADQHWMYEYEGELYAPSEWLSACERISDDAISLDRLSRARLHYIDAEPIQEDPASDLWGQQL